ncbi:MAG: DUF4331 domain-containing protein [Anaerolineales bacterium]
MKPQMTKGFVILAMLLTPILILAGIFAAHSASEASSHREAPLISKDPFADNTDTYIFVPAGQTENVAIIGSWIPFEGPEGGPNYFEFDDQVRYDLYLDLDGDATAEVTYTLRTTTTIGAPTDTFLYNTGPINSVNDATWNRPQVYSLVEKFEPGMQPAGSNATNVLVNNGRTAPANIGSKSTPDYQALVNEVSYTYTDPGNGDTIKIFAGQTDDAFWVDLQVFDLLTLRGQPAPIGYTTGNKTPVDSLSGFNVHSIVLEIPISRLVRNGDPVLGMWAGARRVGMGVFSGTGNPVQVSRLGMPLVNEVVLPMGLKDTFNAIPPSVDLTVYGLLQESVENPEVGTLLCALYGVPLPGDTNNDCNTEYTPGTPRTGRGDIFDIFLTGMVLANPFTINTAGGPVTLPAGFNVNRPASVIPAEMIRINTAISGDLCAPIPSPLGVLGGDACGFPNGRRLMDDVVEIELLAVAGAAYQVLDGRDASFVFNPALIGVLNDGVNGNDVRFAKGFPYMGLAQSGQNHIHKNSSGRTTVLTK